MLQAMTTTAETPAPNARSVSPNESRKANKSKSNTPKTPSRSKKHEDSELKGSPISTKRPSNEKVKGSDVEEGKKGKAEKSPRLSPKASPKASPTLSKRSKVLEGQGKIEKENTTMTKRSDSPRADITPETRPRSSPSSKSSKEEDPTDAESPTLKQGKSNRSKKGASHRDQMNAETATGGPAYGSFDWLIAQERAGVKHDSSKKSGDL